MRFLLGPEGDAYGNRVSAGVKQILKKILHLIL